jgi:2,5-diamino-6-(ribosylamino)-4(3H)-pyrimidinone 5'-phosphate reductase
MLPHVILFNAVSLDGRVVGFPADIALFYELAARWQEDATLAGSDTFLTASEEIPPEEPSDLDEPPKNPEDHRPLLVVPDSRGRLRRWHYLRRLPYWRGAVALCSRATPAEYLDYLQQRHIDTLIAGEDHVDMAEALQKLHEQYGVNTIRVDSGGTLNGVLLRAGLVDEVSLLIHPSLVGGLSPRSIFRAPDLPEGVAAIPLRLRHAEQIKDELVWLRYEIVR